MVPCSNHGQVIYSGSRDLGLETRELPSTIIYTNSVSDENLCSRDRTIFDFDMKSIYFSQKVNFKVWFERKFSTNYSREMFNTFEKVFLVGKCVTLQDFVEFLHKGQVNERSLRNSFRVWLNYVDYKVNCKISDNFIKLYFINKL